MRISDRESSYHHRRFQRSLSPDRAEEKESESESESKSAGGVDDSSSGSGSYDDEKALALQAIRRQRAAIIEAANKKLKEERLADQRGKALEGTKKRRRRWGEVDESEASSSSAKGGKGSVTFASSSNDKTDEIDDKTPERAWGSTPERGEGGDEGSKPARRSRWADTPASSSASDSATAAVSQPSRKRSRWDQTPAPSKADAIAKANDVARSSSSSSSSAMRSSAGMRLNPEAAKRIALEREMDARNRPLTDDELDAMFPTSGYTILNPPDDYMPAKSRQARVALSAKTPKGADGFSMAAQTPGRDSYGVPLMPKLTVPNGGGGGDDVGDLPELKPEDLQYFGKLMDENSSKKLSFEETRERRIMMLLLKVKNGNPMQRKAAFKFIGKHARQLGAAPLFNQLLPLLMSPTLEDQERHLLVKAIDRIMGKLGELVRPFAHKILVVIEPMLIDEDYYARVEGREIISNLAKAAGLATMIATMRPDIDNVDEYVRNTTARAFAVVASALGVPALLPFLRAVCRAKKSWHARHTGVKIVQQIAILVGCAVLPHLNDLVDIVAPGLTDENQKVRSMTALAVASLAEAAHPYGIESFDAVVKPLWKGVRQHRNKVLASFLKAIGFLIPLMDADHSHYYTKAVMPILLREFASPDEAMKKVVLIVVKQCVTTDGVNAVYVREEILPKYFQHFWVRRMALDRRNYKQLVDTTVALGVKVGTATILNRVVNDLKDESEPFRKMVMETVHLLVESLGVSDVDADLEKKLIDGLLFAFQEQAGEDTKIMLEGFGVVINALGVRSKPYLSQICGTLKWRLNNKSAHVRMQAADLIARIASVMRVCDEQQLMGHLGVVLYEYLGEEYPEVLGSIIGALKSIVQCIGMKHMTPPVGDLLPRLTPILKNRHEKVQSNVIDLVGRIADRGAELVSAREWMRICFELLELLNAPRKSIRRATVNTFGYIARAIGPQDVLHTLLNNLKVQERQNRVCSVIAIAIVAEQCGPFTVLPALMNEYRVPDQNVQNGVLKCLSFLFQYIGEMSKDYIWSVTTLLEDALMDRDMIHRQIACYAVKHLALGCAGAGCDDVLIHLLNFVFPNIFETAQHVEHAVFEAIEAIRFAVGPQIMAQYLYQGMFHPARRVREVYARLYNNTYVYSAHALTPAYPRLADDGRNSYQRTHLDLFL